MRMLIVDDSRTMRNYLASIARDLSFQTSEAGDGEEALACLDGEGPFDVALFDWEMPNMDGISLLKKVRQNDELNRMKVLMVTSLSQVSSVCEAVENGADDYLMKPVTPEMVADKLRLLGMLD